MVLLILGVCCMLIIGVLEKPIPKNNLNKSKNYEIITYYINTHYECCYQCFRTKRIIHKI